MENRVNFSSLSIGTRLAAGIALILVLSTGATGYALWTVRSNIDEFRNLAEVQFAQERDMEEWAHRIDLNLVRTLAIAQSRDTAGQLQALADSLRGSTARFRLT